MSDRHDGTVRHKDGDGVRPTRLAMHRRSMTQTTAPLDVLLRPSAFRAFFEKLAVGGVQISTGGRFLQVNDRFSELTGYDRDELLQMSVGDLDHPDDREPDRERWTAFLADPGVGYDVEKRYLRRDGSVIWVHVTAAQVGTGDDPVLIAKTVEDITERVAAESAFRGFFENLGVGGVQIGEDGRFRQVNDRFAQLTGYERRDLLQMSVGDLDHPDDRALDQERWTAFLGEPHVGYDVEKRYLRRDGTVIWVHVTASRIPTGTDRVLIAKTVEDITERVEATGALRAREDHLRAALEVKEEFLGLVSHELRTPLTIILGLANVVTRKGLSPEEVQAANLEIRESAEHLAQLLESMLVLARLGEEVPTLEPLRVDRTVQQVVDRHLEVAPSRSISVDIRTADSLVDGHEPWLKQVISNIVGNAEKYSPPEGRIEVVVEADDGRVVVRVFDEGGGVDTADLPHLFEAFYRSKRAVDQPGGLGLGLAVCKRLVELMGGEIWARDRSGQGAEFGFALPALRLDED
jgi:PAS domain S-box-containing protein